MCRRTQLPGAVLTALGVGFLLSTIFEGEILRILIGVVLLATGLLICHKH